MKAWLFQDSRQKARLGDSCPWSVGWLDPDGRRKSKRLGSKSAAEKFARKVEGQLAAGTYEVSTRRHWDDFIAEYRAKALPLLAAPSRVATENAIAHFERLAKPHRMQAITSKTLADFAAARRLEPKIRPRNGKADDGKGPRVSVATVNRDLRHIKVVLRRAVRWGFLPKLPEVEFAKEPQKIPTYVGPDDFERLYAACEHATMPNDQPYPAADWWRGLLTMAYMTGWRIGALAMLQRSDTDLAAATALSRANDNKGKRDALTPLHPLVVEHLERLVGFDPRVFPWNHGRTTLFRHFAEIQKAAGVRATGSKGRFTFHDLRRGFATMNADRMTADALQVLMQHRDYSTTKRYINLGRQLAPAVANLYVPALPARVAH